MSATPKTQVPQSLDQPVPMTLPRLAEKKRLGEPIVMVTAYDYPSAQVAEAAGVDVVLVGDSAAMTVLGYPSTVAVTIDEMLMLASAARRGCRTPFLVADLPFGSYEVSDEQAVQSALRFVKEAGCDAVKLERGDPASVSRARAIVASGIPVMGHLGLTPQSVNAFGGMRVQARSADGRARLLADARALQDAGAFAVVLEGVPRDLARDVTRDLAIPTDGIGAGPDCDAQVLVIHDLLGITGHLRGSVPKFVKPYDDMGGRIVAAARAYADDVREGRFPDDAHSFH